MSFQRPAVMDVKSLMAKADELVKRIEQLLAHNPFDALTQSTVDPQHNEEVAKGVVELGYRDVRHFCESFPAKFEVNQQFGFISLKGKERSAYSTPVMNWNKETPESYASKQQWNAKYSALSKDIIEAVQYNRPSMNMLSNIDPDRNEKFVTAAAELGFRSVREFCESYPQRDNFFVHPQTGVIGLRQKTPSTTVFGKPTTKSSIFPAIEGQNVYYEPTTGSWLKDRKMDAVSQSTDALLDNNQMQPAKKTAPMKAEDKIHFKITHAGVTRRFALSRAEEDLLSALKAHVLKITGTDDVSLFWKDEDSLIVLDCEDDMGAAIDYAQTQNKLACVTLETGDQKKKEGEKAEGKVVTGEESAAAFNGFPYMCDACDCYLAASNGGRYKCILCDNYDLCAACIAKGEHDNHAFVLLRNGETEVPLKNEAGGVLSMITKDAPRCNPVFVVKSGDAIKGADKIFIDVIDSVGKHVGKKMYDTAEWLKKEAEKMNARREEAEVEEQKMVEEIIRRERREQEKRRREEMRAVFVNADKQAEQMEQVADMEERTARMNMEESKPTSSVDIEAKLAQTMKDRKMAEQMWREEKKHWRDTRKLFKKEEKALRKENKHRNKFHRGAERCKQEEKPEEKKTPEQIEKEEKERKERFMANPVGALIEELLLPAAKSMQAYVTLDSDVSSDDSDVELLEKPVEKSDSIVSDLVILDDQAPKQEEVKEEENTEQAAEQLPTDPPAAEQETTNALQAQLDELRQQQKQQQDFAAAITVDTKRTAFHKPDQQQVPIGFMPPQPMMGQEQQFPAPPMMVPPPTPLHRQDRRSQPNMYPELPVYRNEIYEPFGVGRDVRERGGGFQRSALRPEEIDELYARAHRIPTHMEIAVLGKLQKLTVEELKHELDQFLHHLKNNTHSRLRHSPVLSTNPDVADDDLIRMIAVDLMARLQSMKKIVHNAAPADVMRMIENRLLELRAAVQNGAYDNVDELKASELYQILLTSAYTGRFGFSTNPFQGAGNMWGERGFGRRSMRDRHSSYYGDLLEDSHRRFGSASNGWNSYLPGFMQAPAANVANAAYNAASTTAASVASAASAAASAATAAKAARSPTAAASAPAAEQQASTADMTTEQKRVLRQLFETGMFEDNDRMVEVCRRATTLEEAIDLMLQ